jgi:hypothetical protein
LRERLSSSRRQLGNGAHPKSTTNYTGVSRERILRRISEEIGTRRAEIRRFRGRDLGIYKLPGIPTLL